MKSRYRVFFWNTGNNHGKGILVTAESTEQAIKIARSRERKSFCVEPEFAMIEEAL